MEMQLKFLAECHYQYQFPLCDEHFLSHSFLADVRDNILGLDFMNEFKITVNCDNLTLNDNLTGLSTRHSLTPVDKSHSSVQVVKNDFSSIKNF